MAGFLLHFCTSSGTAGISSCVTHFGVLFAWLHLSELLLKPVNTISIF